MYNQIFLHPHLLSKKNQPIMPLEMCRIELIRTVPSSRLITIGAVLNKVDEEDRSLRKIRIKVLVTNHSNSSGSSQRIHRGLRLEEVVEVDLVGAVAVVEEARGRVPARLRELASTCFV